MKKNNINGCLYILAQALFLSLTACSSGGGGDSSANTLSWVAPSEREDGTALSLSQIGGYRIYYGTEPGVYFGSIGINDPTATEFKIQGIPAGNYFAVMTTIDTNGRESYWSEPELQVSF